MQSFLIVDSDRIARDCITSMLQAAGVHVVGVSDAESALAVLGVATFDSVVVDPAGLSKEQCQALDEGVRQVGARIVIAGSPGGQGVQPMLQKPWPSFDEVADRLGIDGSKSTSGGSSARDLHMLKERCKDLETRLADSQNAVSMAQESFNHDISRMMNIISNIMDGIVFTDTEGEITLLNPIAEEMLELRALMSVGRNLLDLEGGELLEAVQDSFDAVKEWRENDAVVEVHQEGGELTYVRLRMSQVRNFRGEPSGMLIQMQDVTADHKTDQLKNQYLSIVAHELRTPLTGIKTYATMMSQGFAGELDERQQEIAGIIREQSLRLEHQIDKLVNLGNLDSTEFADDPEDFDIRGLIQNSVQSFEKVAEERSIEIDFAMPDSKCVVCADRADLRRAIQALVENAVKFSKTDGQVRVKVCEVDGGYEFSIADDGVGIDPRYQRRIFEKFFQVEDPLTRHHGGSGLGLFFVKNIVEAHGAKVQVESAVGEGARFSFTLAGSTADGKGDRDAVPVEGTST
ncbi:MAG: ATP-binding protein [Planctomycetota bacterium]